VAVILQLGSGDAEARKKIYSQLLGANAPIKNSGKLGPNWKRLSSKTLHTVKDDENEEKDFHDNIQEKAIDWATKTLMDYDNALRRQSAK
jgi:hypothetical protein